MENMVAFPRQVDVCSLNPSNMFTRNIVLLLVALRLGAISGNISARDDWLNALTFLFTDSLDKFRISDTP